jgi:hypothetical protein
VASATTASGVSYSPAIQVVSVEVSRYHANSTSPLSLGTGSGHGILIRSRSDGPLRRGTVLMANRCQSHLLKIGFHVGFEVDTRVAKTLRWDVKTLRIKTKPKGVRGSNGFRGTLLWWEGVVSDE